MRVFLTSALAALAGFSAGLAGARGLRVSTPQAEAAPTPQPARPASISIPEPRAESPAASHERLQAVLALGEKNRGLAEDQALFAAVQKLDARDLLAGVDEFVALVKRRDELFNRAASPLCEAWFEHWLDVDTPGALRFLGTSPMLQELYNPSGSSLLNRVDSAQGSAFKILARRQPEWTQQFLAAMKPGPQREVGVYQLLREVAQQDSAKAQQFLAGFTVGENRPAAVQGCVSGLVAGNVRAGFEVALAEAAGPFREELLKVAFRGAAERGIGTVRELLDRIDDPALRRRLAAEAVRQVGWESREDLLPWIMEETQRTTAIEGWEAGAWGQALGQSSGTNVVAAADWAATLKSDPERKLLLSILGYVSGAGLRDWLGGHASALDAPTLERLGYVMTNLARNDPEATREWAAALPAGPLRERAQFQVALSSGAEGNLSQAEAIYESLAARDTSGELAKQLATVLAVQDGAAAAEWAMRRPEGPARAAALKVVAEQWSQRDPRGAAVWLGQMPPGAEHDVAVREYAAKLAFLEPSAAAEWIEQVADPTMRGEAAVSVFFTWNYEDPVAAHAWLRALPGVDEKWRADFFRRVKFR